mmetsp:Transcript_24416/g.61035  ORF Transcript_24416/g.61035 Transcript_24416/m.61035 type:complete len:301 (-) Transcript_24416:336-1238(-)
MRVLLEDPGSPCADLGPLVLALPGRLAADLAVLVEAPMAAADGLGLGRHLAVLQDLSRHGRFPFATRCSLRLVPALCPRGGGQREGVAVVGTSEEPVGWGGRACGARVGPLCPIGAMGPAAQYMDPSGVVGGTCRRLARGDLALRRPNGCHERCSRRRLRGPAREELGTNGCNPVAGLLRLGRSSHRPAAAVACHHELRHSFAGELRLPPAERHADELPGRLRRLEGWARAVVGRAAGLPPDRPHVPFLDVPLGLEGRPPHPRPSDPLVSEAHRQLCCCGEAARPRRRPRGGADNRRLRG